MQLEIMSASNLLAHFVRIGRQDNDISDNQVTRFRDNLINLLQDQYRDHWFPENPSRGSGFRCIETSKIMSPIIIQAGQTAGLSVAFSHLT